MKQQYTRMLIFDKNIISHPYSDMMEFILTQWAYYILKLFEVSRVYNSAYLNPYTTRSLSCKWISTSGIFTNLGYIRVVVLLHLGWGRERECLYKHNLGRNTSLTNLFTTPKTSLAVYKHFQMVPITDFWRWVHVYRVLRRYSMSSRGVNSATRFAEARLRCDKYRVLHPRATCTLWLTVWGRERYPQLSTSLRFHSA